MSHAQGNDLADERRNANTDAANPQESPAPSSLREQIKAITTFQQSTSHGREWCFTNEGINKLEAIVTTYIEAAEIDARQSELEMFKMPDYRLVTKPKLSRTTNTT